MSTKNVIVIGGGIAGLAASIYLARGGRRVTVFERRPHLGGRAVTHLRRGYRFNLGPHAFYRGGPGWQVCRELGIPVRGGIPDGSGIAMLGGDRYRFPGNFLKLLTTNLLPLKARFEAAKLFVRIRRIDAKRFASMTAAEWLDANVSNDRLRQTIAELNSKGLFEAQEIDVSDVRRIDKARLILSRFSKNGRLKQILDKADDVEDDFAAAFLLGCLATDNFWIETHEEAVFEGYAHIEGRESGRPLAVAARLRQGKRSRRAVIEAASKLYLAQPLLERNDSRTAALIEDYEFLRSTGSSDFLSALSREAAN